MTATPSELTHAPDCPGPRLVTRETVRFELVTCTACGAHIARPRVNRWREAPA